MNTHTCAKCKEVKPISEFNRDNKRMNGLYPYCKPCQRAAGKASYARHREQTIARQQARVTAKRQAKDPDYLAKRRELQRKRRATHPGEEAVITRTYQQRHPDRVHATRKKHWQNMTPEERITERERLRAYKAANPEHVRTVHTRWRHANQPILAEYMRKRRASKRGAPEITLTPAQWEMIKEAFDHRCAYCNRKMKRLEQDHITPLVNGGAHTLHNVVPACRTCNAKKGKGEPLSPVQPLLL